MIDAVVKALGAYGKLDTVGKRLFRDEIGLVRPQQAKRRKARKPAEANGNVAQAAAPVRKRRRAAAALDLDSAAGPVQ